VVKIDGVGDVTQQQLMTMQYLWSLDDINRKGNLCYSWLMSTVDEQSGFEAAGALAKRLSEAWALSASNALVRVSTWIGHIFTVHARALGITTV